MHLLVQQRQWMLSAGVRRARHASRFHGLVESRSRHVCQPRWIMSPGQLVVVANSNRFYSANRGPSFLRLSAPRAIHSSSRSLARVSPTPDLSTPDGAVGDLERKEMAARVLRSADLNGEPPLARKRARSDSPVSDPPGDLSEDASRADSPVVTHTHAAREEIAIDPEADEDATANPKEVEEALSRPPPVNSDYLPLPWKGRLGYACLCTYLRYSNPPVFSSRTCRISSILENRHPPKNPFLPPHPTKNRPDRTKPADPARGQAYVESLGLANARDVIKMLRWNDRYGIKFMRLSSEMFPFASHETYGYKLAPFASEVLAEVGRVAAELGHRLTVHPGQFTQLGSPRKQVIENSIRDLEYHSEMLQLLKLPPQQDRDAVMVLHMGGTFGDKAATLDRFRENYKLLSQDIKNRLVLENDDVSWSVHDLLPICEELNIPLVLDFHHHNIVFDSDKVREGTLDIMQLFDRIKATWTRKGITQKMHYSEPTPSAITNHQRRKHNPRVETLPPCDPTMDLMIEAKDKEQAVFELMRKFKLPGYELINDMIPHVRTDENEPAKPYRYSTKNGGFIDLEQLASPPATIPEEEVGMGGPERRVYWPPGKEDWLRPAKKPAQSKPGKGSAAKSVSVKKTRQATKASQVQVTDVKDKPVVKYEAPTTRARAKRTASVKALVRKRKASRAASASSSEEDNLSLSELSDVTTS